MAAHIAWNGYKIGGRESGAIRSYKDFSYSFSTKTKARDGNDVLYVGRQGYNAIQAQVTLNLRAALGDDVAGWLERFKNDSRSGVCARLLVGGRDLFGSDFLLTGADVSQTQVQPMTGTMTGATVKLTWQESDGQVYDNTDSSHSSVASLEESETKKGSGSSYLKKTGNDTGGNGNTSGTDSAGKGNLTGSVGGYNPSGISSSAKKISLPCSSTKKDSAIRSGKTTASSK